MAHPVGVGGAGHEPLGPPPGVNQGSPRADMRDAANPTQYSQAGGVPTPAGSGQQAYVPTNDDARDAPSAIPPAVAAQSQAGRIRHSAQVTGNNAGMMGGMAMGMFGGGGNMVGDMIAGQVVGNIMGQQVGRHQANVALASGAAGTVPLDPDSRQGKRAQRRAKRYERRTERHNKVKKLFGGGGSGSSDSSSGSDSEKEKEHK